MEIPLLKDIFLIFAVALLVVIVCHRLRVPTIVGFLLTGVLAGPHGLGLIRAVHEVEILAEVGVVLLLFTIGLEFSLDSLIKMKTTVLAGGAAQIFSTGLAAAAVSLALGRPPGQAVFFAFLVALSSTAIVLKILQDRAEIDSPHGKVVLGVLIFQDIAVVPMMLFTPLLAGAGQGILLGVMIVLGKGAAVVALTVILARWLIPKILHQAAGLRDQEMFLLAVVCIGLGIAWLTSAAGLSLALGAFLAGLIISESEYSRAALGNMIPFRDVFTSLFFVSIGMLLDTGFFLDHPLMIVLAAAGVITLKAAFAGASTLALGQPFRTSVLAGVSLAQIGEFSFILSMVGLKQGLIAGEDYQLFLAVAVLTMISAPFAIASGNRISDLALKLPLPRGLKKGWRTPKDSEEPEPWNDHLIIVGYGPAGRNLSVAAQASDIPYLIIELNPETVRKEKAAGQPIHFGDAAQPAVLEHAGVEKARVLVVGVPDPPATRRVVEQARRHNPRLYIIVRTPYIREMEPLYRLGASEVIPAEFETSIEVFARVLDRYLVPREEIHRFIGEVRKSGYEMFRSASKPAESFCDLRAYTPDQDIAALRVEQGSKAAGRSLGELAFRGSYGVTVMAVRRGDRVISNPGADQELMAGDVAVLIGDPENLEKASSLFKGS
jgi:CPA2 family monovalent cation:H+ antiporter-2